MEIVKETSEDEISDREKEQIAAGDERAFRRVFNLYFKILVQFVYSITKAREAATEIVNWVFVKFWQNREKTPGIRNIKIYLYASTKNAALNYLQQSKPAVVMDIDTIPVELKSESNPEQRMISKELQAKIKEAIDDLPNKCRMVFKLVREDGLSYKETAEVLDVSIKTVDAQMTIAVKRISENMRKDLNLVKNWKKL